MSDASSRRLGLRFGLRTMLVLMLLASAFFGGWAANEWKHRRELERAKAEALRQTLLPSDIPDWIRNYERTLREQERASRASTAARRSDDAGE